MKSWSVEKILEAVPTAKVVRIPPGWYDLGVAEPTFDKLYNWLLDTGVVGREKARNLHNHVYASVGAMKKLLKAERRRLAKKWRISGEELDRALGMVNISSGPQELFADRSIAGDALIVMDEDDEAGEGGSRLFMEGVTRENRKIAKAAHGSNFFEWVIGNIGRQDPVGDIASDFMGDSRYPRAASSYGEILCYLRKCHPCDSALAAFNRAWEEYKAKYPRRMVKSAWCDECSTTIAELKDGLLLFGEDGDPTTVHVACAAYDEGQVVVPLHYTGLFREFALGREYDADCMGHVVEFLNLHGLPVEDAERTSAEQVYFIQAGKGGPVKIGYSGTSVEKRLASLQTAHPETLTLLAVMNGSRVVEKELHGRFARWRRSGEWFEPVPELMEFIAGLEGL